MELDNNKIGDFLKRLRVNAKYTQADLGFFINVSDKAVSRWESGTGTPEIGNLMTLAKLYGISVDDILNCNEAVFNKPAAESQSNTEIRNSAAAEPQTEPRGEEQPTPDLAHLATQSAAFPRPAPAASGMPAAAVTGERRILQNPSSHFPTILFLAYIALGSFLFSLRPESFVGIFIPAIVCVTAAAVLPFVGAKLPRLAVYIAKNAIYGILAVLTLVGMIVAFVMIPIGQFAAHGYIVMLLLFLIQPLYIQYDNFNAAIAKKFFAIAACAVAAAALIFATVIFIYMANVIDFSFANFYRPDNESIPMGMLFVSLAACLFTVAQLRSLWINVLLSGVLLIVMVFSFVPIFNIAPLETPIVGEVKRYTNFSLIYFGMCLAWTVADSISWYFENRKYELNARRITAATVLFLIPLIVFTFDALALNFVTDYATRTAVQFLRLFVLFAVIAGQVKAARPELLLPRRKKS